MGRYVGLNRGLARHYSYGIDLGSDTTSTTITSTIFYLLHNSVALSRLSKEVRSKFDSVEAIQSGPLLNSCIYLRACIDEVMRMSPPVPSILPHQTLDGGLEILGEKLPAGIGVGCPIYALHHNADHVLDPFTYKPERWILGEGARETELKNLHAVLNPFSIGPRGFIGKPMAYLELSVVLARLIWEYDMRLMSGPLGKVGEGNPNPGRGRERAGEFQLKDIFVSKIKGPFADFRLRK